VDRAGSGVLLRVVVGEAVEEARLVPLMKRSQSSWERRRSAQYT